MRLNTITPDEAEQVRAIENMFVRQEATQAIAHRNIQAGVIDGILKRAVKLNIVTPEVPRACGSLQGMWSATLCHNQ
ncbi:MAG: hypothetical protein WCP21_19785 [Armatimonadota bacterium]